MTGAALVIGFALGAVAGLWLGQHRGHVPTSDERLVRRAYRGVDEVTGATRYENQLRTDMRFRLVHPRFHPFQPWRNWRLLIPRKVREWIADYFWPIARRGDGTNPLPSDRRIAQYVWHGPDLITVGGVTIPRTWHIHYTTEAAANHPPFIEWLTRGRPLQGGGLAQVLGLEWKPDLFLVERDWSRALVHLTIRDQVAEALPDRPPMDVRSAT